MQSHPSPEQEVERAFAAFMTAFNSMDVQGLAECFAPDVTLFAPAGAADLISGASAVCSHFQRVFAAEPASGPGIQPLNLCVTKLSSEAAVVTFEFARAAQSLGRRTVAFRRTEGHWWVVHIHASNR